MAERLRRFLVVALLVCEACGNGSPARSEPTAPPGGALVRFASGSVAAEIADSSPEWRRGLMHRTRLAEDAGMIFLFPASQRGGFWMKDTLIPLSIAYMSRREPGRYVAVALLDMVPCRFEPCPVYDPMHAYDAALEVNRGWFAVHGVRRGMSATVSK